MDAFLRDAYEFVCAVTVVVAAVVVGMAMTAMLGGI